jgi:hypothetical protein
MRAANHPRQFSVGDGEHGQICHGVQLDAFRIKYPTATEQTIDAAVFHIFVDGIEAARDWIADAELFLTDPQHRLSFGVSSHLLYHVYNWHQLESLMPHGKQGMHELADDIARYAEEGNLEAVKEAVKEFKELIESNQLPPDIH